MGPVTGFAAGSDSQCQSKHPARDSKMAFISAKRAAVALAGAWDVLWPWLPPAGCHYCFRPVAITASGRWPLPPPSSCHTCIRQVAMAEAVQEPWYGYECRSHTAWALDRGGHGHSFIFVVANISAFPFCIMRFSGTAHKDVLENPPCLFPNCLSSTVGNLS